MNVRRSIPRQFALIAAAHAKRILAKRNAFWAEGMEQETHYIDDDWSALRWALGCVCASYMETSKAKGPLLTSPIRIFLAGLIFYFSCENFLGPVQALLCYMQVSKPASQLLTFFPIERTMCITWPAIPMVIQITSLVAGALYLVSALLLFRNVILSIRWFIVAFAVGSIAFVVEQGLPSVTVYRYSALFEQTLLRIIVGRAVSPILVAIALWLSSGSIHPRTGKERAI